MAPIHYAVAARKDFVLKALLEFNANVEVEVCFYIAVIPVSSNLVYVTSSLFYTKDATGQRPLHLCAKGYVLLPKLASQ